MIGDILKLLARQVDHQLFGGGGSGVGLQAVAVAAVSRSADCSAALAEAVAVLAFGQFATGGFSGGNPMQSILGGQSNNGGGRILPINLGRRRSRARRRIAEQDSF